MNQLDAGLIQSIRQLSQQTQSATARGAPDFVAKQLEERMSVMERAQDWKQVLTGSGMLSEQQRHRLIELGNDYVTNMETLARSEMSYLADTEGKLEQFWSPDSEQIRIAKGGSNAVSFSGEHGTAAAPGSAPGGVHTLKSGRKIIFGAPAAPPAAPPAAAPEVKVTVTPKVVPTAPARMIVGGLAPIIPTQ
jgi:hypothetical protein